MKTKAAICAASLSAARGHVRAALGSIRDPASLRRVLAFAEGEPEVSQEKL